MKKKTITKTTLSLATAMGCLGLAATSANAVTLIDTDTGNTDWLLQTNENQGPSTLYEGNLVATTIDRDGLGDGNNAPWSRGVVGGNASGFIQYQVDGAGTGLAATSTGTWTFSNLAAGLYDVATSFHPSGGSNIRYTVNGGEVFVDQSTTPAANAGPTFSGNYDNSRTNDIFFTTIGTSLAITEGGTITITVDNSDNVGAQRTLMDSVGVTRVSAIPEPSTFGLLGLGALGMILRRRRK